MAYGGIAKQIPAIILAELTQSRFLSLGMDLSDWSIRNIFRRIWEKDQDEYKSWVIQADIDAEEEKLWSPYNVDIIKVKLNRYIANLTEEIDKLPPEGNTA